MKTFAEWVNSNQDFNEYLKVNNEVDYDLFLYIVGGAPQFHNDIIQCGVNEGKNNNIKLYETFKQTKDNKYFYLGLMSSCVEN